jgi:hypothetical protein
LIGENNVSKKGIDENETYILCPIKISLEPR